MDQLRDDAIGIWRAGVNAVDSSNLVRAAIDWRKDSVSIAGQLWRIPTSGRICVVGAGKAGAGMAEGFESTVPPEHESRVAGWVNVPEDCVRDLRWIHLHGARPAGLNEPTESGVEGTREILRRVSSLTEDDLCVVLISGGGSALLPAPIAGVTLVEKQEITRQLMRCGATIQQLNCVRRALSEVKGGGLLRACRAGRLVAVIISDVIGDPLETIASGPTVNIPSAPQEALRLLESLESENGVLVADSIKNALRSPPDVISNPASPTCDYSNHVIGNNRTAVEAAARRATQLGYVVVRKEAEVNGIAREIGEELASLCLEIKSNRQGSGKACIISGGEPIVHLVKTDQTQKGGRNQELVLAAARKLWSEDSKGIVILSGGTDGEDGPTDAAGAVIDDQLLWAAREHSLSPGEFLSVNNSYPFFEQIGGLLKTGPTHTNVMDLRVAIVAR